MELQWISAGLQCDHRCSETQRDTRGAKHHVSRGEAGVGWPHAQGCPELPATARRWKTSGAPSPQSLQGGAWPCRHLDFQLPELGEDVCCFKASCLWDLAGALGIAYLPGSAFPSGVSWGPLATLVASSRTSSHYPEGGRSSLRPALALLLPPSLCLLLSPPIQTPPAHILALGLPGSPDSNAV